jgi:hypothetical protein
MYKNTFPPRRLAGGFASRRLTRTPEQVRACQATTRARAPSRVKPSTSDLLQPVPNVLS